MGATLDVCLNTAITESSTAGRNAAAVLFCAGEALPKRVSADDRDTIARYIAEKGTTLCPPNRGAPRAAAEPHRPQRNTNRARKPGERYANGHRKPDPVDEMTDLDPPPPAEAGYVTGQLWLAGDLTDPIDIRFESAGAYRRAAEDARRRHDAATDYATMHYRLWGSGTAPSHLRNMLAGMHVPPATDTNDAAGLAVLTAKWRRWETAAMTTPPCGRLLGIDVLRRAALYEMAPDNPADMATLRRVLDRLVELKSGRIRRAVDESIEPTPTESTIEIAVESEANVARRRRLDRYQPNFTRKGDGPAAPLLARAVARFKTGLVDGRGD